MAASRVTQFTQGAPLEDGMHQEYQKLYSPILGRDMEVSVYGHGGTPIIVFPTSLAPHFEWQDRKMTDSLGEQLERGWNQLFCVQTLDADDLYAKGTFGRAWKPPAERIALYAAYQRHLTEEMAPYIFSRNPDHFLIAAGASFGAFHAVNFAFRNPGTVRRVIAMSGLYDLREWMDGYYDDNVYFNNPVDYLANLHDEHILEQLRSMDIILVAGDSSGEAPNNRQLSQLLWDKGIWHAMRWWDGWAHDWPWWRQEIAMYLNGA
jgi:esterase/lipase superfamily enzyme